MKRILCLLFLLLILSSCGEKIDTTAYDTAIADGEICVLIDAGHGLSDVGAMNEENLGTVTEAAINFAISKNLENELLSRGYTVIMSHDGKEKPFTEYDDGEETYGPSERADFANSTAADMFISIHCDSFPDNENVYGTRLYYAVNSPNSSKLDKYLASAVGDKINSRFPNDKEVILKPMSGDSAFTVLYKTKAPSLLVECGFITNKDDAGKLIDTDWQKEFALSIADGIDAYYVK